MSTVDRVALIEAQINALQTYMGRLESRFAQIEQVVKIVGSWAVVNKQFLDSVLEIPKPKEEAKVEVVKPEEVPVVPPVV